MSEFKDITVTKEQQMIACNNAGLATSVMNYVTSSDKFNPDKYDSKKELKAMTKQLIKIYQACSAILMARNASLLGDNNYVAVCEIAGFKALASAIEDEKIIETKPNKEPFDVVAEIKRISEIGNLAEELYKFMKKE